MSSIKHAVVIGGGRGIGEAIVRRLAEDGYSITIVDRLQAETAALAAKLRAAGHSAGAVAADIADPDQMAALGAILKQELGSAGLAAAVNSVGIFDERANVLNTSVESFRRVIDVNLIGAFLFSKAVAPLLAPGGSLVHIGSVNQILAGRDLGAYKVSKAGLHMMSRCLALELAADPRRVRVNIVAPGWVDTPGERQVLKAEKGKPHPLDDDSKLDYIPLHRRTLPSEIADAVGFLCSPRASAITGQTIYVDGGITTYASPE
jgi:NAD(P)-dependent dehydrogenase (short-subunit alcohol dehydrogenase family)